ncbi:hypothetical protein BHE74_00023180 [Ensete ventricosum]|nr:hypothetical protein BHE74_00023180 [Ensete ventricosum]
MDEGEKAEVGEVESRDEGELDHHVVDTTGGDVREDKMEGGGNEDAQEEEEGPVDYCVFNIKLNDAHPPKAGSKAPELVTNTGEATFV